MSKNYNKIKRYYDEELWGINRVRNMVKTGNLTEQEFYEITGETYNET